MKIVQRLEGLPYIKKDGEIKKIYFRKTVTNSKVKYDFVEFNMTEEEYLSKFNLTKENLKKDMEKELIAVKYMGEKTDVTEEEAKNYYDKNKDEFLPIISFESKTSSFGDFNIINPNNFFTGLIKDLRLLVLWIINNSQ